MEQPLLLKPSEQIESEAKSKTVVNYLQCVAFVTVYIGIGLVFKLEANTYLLIGIPLTLAFQLFIRRKPITDLWVKNVALIDFNRLTIILILGFCICPVYGIIDGIWEDKLTLNKTLYLISALAGTIGAGFAASKLNRKSLKYLLLCLLIVGSIGSGLVLLSSLGKSMTEHTPVHFNFPKALRSLLLYIPISFVLEEVIFRGLLDSHITNKTKNGTKSALFISALWALWHLPLGPPDGNLLLNALGLLFVHCLVGIPLSIFWRKSGNLMVPAFSHAFIDAIRNGFA